MVSADNLNFDVLELIFTHLEQHDLFHLCLVSRNFLAAVIPILYRSISYDFSQSPKSAVRRASAFDTVLLHPALAGHIRQIHIALPILSSEQVQNCRAVLGLRENTSLDSFVCTPSEVKTFVDILPTLSSISYLRVNVQLLKEEEQPSLLKVRGIRSITLEFASWRLINVLPTWAADSLGSTLKNLTFHSCSGLTEDMIRATVAHLPNLTGLHIITCKGFDFPDVFGVIQQMPSLNSLSFSIWDLTRSRENFEPFSLPNLKELVVDILGTTERFPLKSFLSIFSLFEDAPLTSLAICGRSQTIPALPLASYELLINQHAKTLRRAVLLKANIPNLALQSICKTCKQLEIIGIPVPSAADLPAFIQALRQSDTLHTLVHVPGGSSSGHLLAHPIDRTNVTRIMTSTRRLRRVEGENQIWLGKFSADLKFELKFEKRRERGFIERWYMPPETL